MLDLANKEEIKKIYGVDDWENVDDFLRKVAIKFGRLLR